MQLCHTLCADIYDISEGDCVCVYLFHKRGCTKVKDKMGWSQQNLHDLSIFKKEEDY